MDTRSIYQQDLPKEILRYRLTVTNQDFSPSPATPTSTFYFSFLIRYYFMEGVGREEKLEIIQPKIGQVKN